MDFHLYVDLIPFIWFFPIIALTITKIIFKMPFDSWLQLWRRLKVLESGLASWSWLWLPTFSLKMHRWSMSFKSWLGALEDAGGFWMFFFVILDLDLDIGTCLWYSPVSHFVLYLDFEGAKNINVLEVLILGFGGCWRFLNVS